MSWFDIYLLRVIPLFADFLAISALCLGFYWLLSSICFVPNGQGNIISRRKILIMAVILGLGSCLFPDEKTLSAIYSLPKNEEMKLTKGEVK